MHLKEEKQLMAIAIVPFDAGLGADIRGLDLSAEVSATDAALLRQAWCNHLVLRLREQPITDHQHMSFSRIFGEIELTPAGVLARDYGVDNGGGRAGSLPPQITVVSNVVEDGKVIGDLGDGELEWHTDASFLETPPHGSALRALEIPPAGGETGFINMYSAFDGLPAPLKRKALDINLLHSRLKSSDGIVRRGFENFAITDPSQVPGAVHPAVRTHPDSGKKVLYLGRRQDAYVMGMSHSESKALLNEIWAHAVQEQFTWHQEWRLGDLVIWDNRCTMHRRNAFDPGMRRRMHRTQIVSKRVAVFAPQMPIGCR
jgi:taurine dioxygenase